MSRHFKIDDDLTREQRLLVLQLATDPSKTVEYIHEVICGFGKKIGRTAVFNWRRHVRQQATTPGEDVMQLIRGAPDKIKTDTYTQIRKLIEADLAGA
jgi:hypothetical protein